MENVNTCECRGERPDCLCQAPEECIDCGETPPEPLAGGRCGECRADRGLEDVEAALAGMLEASACALEDAGLPPVVSVTNANPGAGQVILSLADGSEFQISIFRSRRPRRPHLDSCAFYNAAGDCSCGMA